mgnify:CR=1 FL=1
MEKRCQYCFCHSTDIKEIDLRINGKWDHSIDACSSCRKYLFGLWRYYSKLGEV